MKKGLSLALGNSVLYSISGILLRASSIILFPVFSLCLTKFDYGVLSITQSITTFLTLFASMELSRGLTRFLYLEEFKKFSQKQIAGTTLIFVILSNVAIALILLFSGKILLKPLLGEIDFYPYMFFSLLTIPLTSIFDFYRAFLKSINIGKRVLFLELSYYGGNILFNLIFVVIYKMGVIGIIYSTLVVGVIFAIYFFIRNVHQFLLKLDFNILKPLLKYSFPLFIYILLGIILESTDRIFLNNIKGVNISGVYYIALTFATVFSAVKEAFNSAFIPWFFKNKTDYSTREINKVFYFIIIGAGIFCAGISMFGYEVLYLLSNNPDLVDAAKYIPLTVYSLFVVFVGQLYNIPVLYDIKLSRTLIYSNLTAIIISVALSYFLIPVYGEYGSLFARLAAFSVMTIIQLIICSQIAKHRVNYFIIAGISSLFFCISFICYLPVDYIYLLVLKITTTIIISVIFLYFVNKEYKIISRYFNKNNL